MRFICLCFVLSSSVAGAADEPSDLSEYKTVAQAKTTTIVRTAQAVTVSQPGYLGVSVEADKDGVRINGLAADSPAAKAGIPTGALLRKLDGKPIATVEAFRDRLQAKAPGDTIELVLAHDKNEKTVSLTLGAPSAPLQADDPRSTGSRRLLLGVQTNPEEGGLKIELVRPGLPADDAGIKVGDLLEKVGDKAVKSSTELAEVLGAYKPGDTVIVRLKRDGKEVEKKVKLAAAADPRGLNFDTRSGVFRKEVYRLAVLPIAYPDQELNPKVTPADWEKALFSTGEYIDKSPTGQKVYGSMNDYYREISCGKLRVEGKVFTPVKVSKKRTEYSNTPRKETLLLEVLDLLTAREGKDVLSKFDGVFFLYAGGRVQTNRGGLYWPHRSRVRYNNTSLSYFICPEGGERMASISTITHEFGHMLGLPDLYARPEQPGSEGVGVWCTMSTGHGNDGKPLHFSAWCKEQLGWLKPTVIDPSEKQKLILSPILGSTTECFKVLIRPDGSEYLLLENRVRKGYDRDLPGEGLLIWRVVDGKVLLEESHGITTAEGPQRFLGSIPYPSASNTAFTPFTTPSSRSLKGGGKPVHITNIRRLADGRITFRIGYEYF